MMRVRTPGELFASLEELVDGAAPSETTLAYANVRNAILTPEVSLALDASGEFPAAVLGSLLRGDVGREMTPVEEGGSLSWDRLLRVCGRLAADDIGVTLCLGGVVLGSLPLIVGGSTEQRARFFRDLREGGLAGLGLSEWAHGSDLLANETVAEGLDEDGNVVAAKVASRFRLRGHKRPINNGSRGENLVVLARTGAADDPFGASLFVLRRGTEGLLNDEPAPWIGYRGMDLSGIRLSNAVVGKETLLRQVGEGFLLTRRTLEISRSGVAMMSVGASVASLFYGLEHAKKRALYGKPIGTLPAVEDLLAPALARAILGMALTRFTARAVGRFAVSARSWSCAAKLLCPELLEANVSSMGVLLGARSLIHEHVFPKLRANAPVLGIFDGSSQLQLDELWRHVRQWPRSKDAKRDGFDSIRGVLRAEKHGFDAWGEDPRFAELSPSAMFWHAARTDPELAVLADFGDMLREAARTTCDPNVRFRASLAAASLYALAALWEAVDRDPSNELLRSVFHYARSERASFLSETVRVIALEGWSSLVDKLSTESAFLLTRTRALADALRLFDARD